MNIARVIEVDGAPMMVVYAKTHGTHTHYEIPITGQCVRYENESMPAPEDVTNWLTMKVQRQFNCRITSRSWDGGIEIRGFEPFAVAA